MKPIPTGKQERLILEYMQDGHEITPAIALEKFQCQRLRARIHDLRKKGYAIHGRRNKNLPQGTRGCYMIYSMPWEDTA